MVEQKYKCKDCRHHVTSKQFREYCWCIKFGQPKAQSIYCKACNRFEKLFILDTLATATTHRFSG